MRAVRLIHPLAAALIATLACAEPPDEPLDTVTVTGSAVGYLEPASNTLLRRETPPLDLPQTVTVLTAQLLSDRAPASMAEALQSVPGVGINQGEGNRDSVVLRGVASTADFLVDGLRDDMQYLRDFYNVQQLEVLSGANGVLSGHGGGGGVINRVTKQAGGRYRDVAAVRSSQDGLRLTADLGDALGSGGAARLNLLTERARSWRDDVWLHRTGVAPALRYDLSQTLQWSGGAERFNDARVADRGVPSLAGRPLQTPVGQFFGDPQRSLSEAHSTAVWTALQWTPTSSLTLRHRSRWTQADKRYDNIYARGLDPSATQVQLAAYTQTTRRHSLINQTELSADTQWWGLQHALNAGIEWGLQHNDNRRLTGYFTDRSPLTTSVWVPVASGRSAETVTWRAAAADADTLSELRYASLYVQDQIKVSPLWHLVIGLRGERTGVDLLNRRSAASVATAETLWSPRAAAVFQPTQQLSLYAGYGASRQSRAGEQLASLTDATAGLAPEALINREVGVKWAPNPGSLLTLAAYELQRRNVAVADPADVTRQVLVEGQRVTGLEAAATVSGTAWQLQATLASQHAVLLADQSPALRAGARLAVVPALTASLWSRLQLSPSLAVGLGLQHRAAILAATQNLTTPAQDVWLPAFGRVDAALYWTASRQWRVQVNAENLLDSRWYASASNNNNILPGTPRSVRVGLMGQF